MENSTQKGQLQILATALKLPDVHFWGHFVGKYERPCALDVEGGGVLLYHSSEPSKSISEHDSESVLLSLNQQTPLFSSSPDQIAGGRGGIWSAPLQSSSLWTW